MNDERGQLLLDYIRLLKDKQPLFFLAENVSGMLHTKHKKAIDNIITLASAKTVGQRLKSFFVQKQPEPMHN